ncbi:MAG: nicotinamide-nucleotide amidohydrolase family protein [Deltaproteobacteria bacterium]|nr:nicotinamide-nucleotide amidohydrolase family protein [Deltaproteobacteria bacterium]
MIKIGLLAIGNELLDGSVNDKNGMFLKGYLRDRGLLLFSELAVSDSEGDIIDGLYFLIKNCDVVITSGGLGPTSDDRTRFAVSHFYNMEPVFDGDNFKKIEEYFVKRGRKVIDSNRVQSFKPDAFAWLNNTIGTADGLFYQDNSCMLFALPGVPHEFEEMVTNVVDKKLNDSFSIHKSKNRAIRLGGIGESVIYEKLKTLDCISSLAFLPDAQKGLLVKFPEEFTVVEDIIKNEFAQYIVSLSGESFEDTIVMELKKRGLTVSLAESCTGGSVCGILTSVPGASDVLKGGVNTYMTSTKISVLKIKEQTILNHGIVSLPCAKEMAKNARDLFDSHIAVSVTGYLGPTGGDSFAKNGDFVIGISVKGGEDEAFKIMAGYKNRSINKKFVIQMVLFHLLKTIRLCD